MPAPAPLRYRTRKLAELPGGFQIHRVFSVSAKKAEEHNSALPRHEGWEKYRLSGATRLSKGERSLFVMHDPRGKIIAAQWVRQSPGAFQILFTSVNPKVRRKGVARALFRQQLDWALRHPHAHTVIAQVGSPSGEQFLGAMHRELQRDPRVRAELDGNWLRITRRPSEGKS